MKIADGELQQLLIKQLKLQPGAVTDLVADSRQTGQSLLSVALASGLTTPEQIGKVYAKKLGIPFVDIEKKLPTSKTVHRLPSELARKYRLVVTEETPTSVKIAMADPTDEVAKQAVRAYSHKTVRRQLATPEGLRIALALYDTPEIHPLGSKQLLTNILEEAVTVGAHVVHFEPHADRIQVRIRVGSKLRILSQLPVKRLAGLAAWCKLQAGLNPQTAEAAQTGNFTIELHGTNQLISITSLPVVHGTKLTLSLLPTISDLPSLEQLGFGGREETRLTNASRDGRGLIVISGSHHHSLILTLRRLALVANASKWSNVHTIEHDIIMDLPGITQATAGDDFGTTLGATLAQSPEVVIIDELPKRQELAKVVDYSLSQHLVIAALKQSAATNVLEHLRSSVPLAAVVASATRLVVTEHYLWRLCPKCRVPAKLTPTQNNTLAAAGISATEDFAAGDGCSHCKFRGHHGLVGAHELIPMTPELQQLLVTAADRRKIHEYVQAHNGLAAQLQRLLRSGTIAASDAAELLATV